MSSLGTGRLRWGGALCLSALALLCACGDDAVDAPNLFVDLRTDLLPGVEFDGVTVSLGEGDGSESISHVAMMAADYVRGVRLGEFEITPSTIRLRTVLFSGGVPTIERVVSVQATGRQTVTIVISRDCRGVECPAAGGDARATECLGGRCEDPRCTPEAPEFCLAQDCLSATECRSSCAIPSCISGACLYSPDDGSCMSGQRCDIDRGCVSSGSLDASVDALVDANVSDAGPDSALVDSGGDVPMEDAGGPDAGPTPCPERWPAAGGCNVQLQTGCTDAQACERGIDTLSGQCRDSDSRGLNDTCVFGDCESGLTCAFLGTGSGTGRCRPMCLDAGCMCPDPSDVCFQSPGSYGVCSPKGCNPVDNTGCPSGQLCIFAGNETSCVDRVGNRGLGDSCVMGFDCQVGLVCAVRGATTCAQACVVAEGSCTCRTLSRDGLYGYCE